MYAATKANVRTGFTAEDEWCSSSINRLFYGGSVMGLCVASLGLIGLGGLFLFL